MKDCKLLEPSLKVSGLNSMYSQYYTGCNGEYYAVRGAYYKCLTVGRHNFNIKIDKVKNNVWKLLIYMCMTASNSNDIKIFSENRKTLKACKGLAVDIVNKYTCSNTVWKDIKDWKLKRAEAVFNDKLNLIGVTYSSCASDRAEQLKHKRDKYTYYNENMPQYKECGTYYELSKYGANICVRRYIFSCGGHVSENVDIDINLLINKIKGKPIFEKFFNPLIE